MNWETTDAAKLRQANLEWMIALKRYLPDTEAARKAYDFAESACQIASMALNNHVAAQKLEQLRATLTEGSSGASETPPSPEPSDAPRRLETAATPEPPPLP